MYQEYLNNPYLQVYVNGYFQGAALTAIILLSIGIFTTVAFALYAKLRGYRKEIASLSKEKAGTDSSATGQRLDSRTEEHLIEMIRKTTPIMNPSSQTEDQMPILKRTDS